jgi:hypothetical protein
MPCRERRQLPRGGRALAVATRRPLSVHSLVCRYFIKVTIEADWTENSSILSEKRGRDLPVMASGFVLRHLWLMVAAVQYF